MVAVGVIMPSYIVVTIGVMPCGVAVAVVALHGATFIVTVVMVSGWAMVDPGGRG